MKLLSEKIADVKASMDKMSKENKERISDLEIQVTIKNEEITKQRTDLDKINKTAKVAQLESLKLKQRI